MCLKRENHCKKSVRIWSYAGPYFPAFGLNTERYEVETERYGVSLRIQSKFGKMRTSITPNADTFYAVDVMSRIVSAKENRKIIGKK